MQYANLSKYSKRRKIVQGVTFLFLLCIPLRLICFDMEAVQFRFLGMRFGLGSLYVPIFILFGLLVYLLYLSMKKGRICCSHLCPVHYHLELVNGARNTSTVAVLLMSALWSVFLVVVFFSFFMPLSAQLEMLADPGRRWFLWVSLAAFAGLMMLFAGFKERFCRHGCPYALIQLVLQHEDTRHMRFFNASGRCTNCGGCDNVCPYNLKVRAKSTGMDCTNCNICHDACNAALGQGNAVLHLNDPEPEED